MKKISMMPYVLLLGLIGCANNGAQPEGEVALVDLSSPAGAATEEAQQLPESELNEAQVVEVPENVSVQDDVVTAEPSTPGDKEAPEQAQEAQDESAGEGASAEEGSWWRWMLRNLPRR